MWRERDEQEQAELAGRVAECQAKLETKLQELRAVANAKQQVTRPYPCAQQTTLLLAQGAPVLNLTAYKSNDLLRYSLWNAIASLHLRP